MAKCSQCLHWDACSMLFAMAIGRKPTANGNKAEEKCPHFKDKTINTNADRIRAMSDEELAELIVKHHPMHAWNKQVREIYFGFDDHRKDNPQKAWLEWLKQPAEGD